MMSRYALLFFLISAPLWGDNAGVSVPHDAPAELAGEQRALYGELRHTLKNGKTELKLGRFKKAAPLLQRVVQIIVSKDLTDFQPFSALMADAAHGLVLIHNRSHELKNPARGGVKDMRVIYNRRIDFWQKYYLKYARPTVRLWFKRAGSYVPYIRSVFKRHGIPGELAYAAMVESGFNPNVRSRADAVGMWQFMENTSKYYDMKIHWWGDERKNIRKATEGAARYLKYLYKKFKSWELALAAYNAGPNRVRRAIKRQKTRDYWELVLPKETENYVPKIMAIILMARELESYGLYLKPDPPYRPDTVVVKDAVSLQTVAECTGSDKKELVDLNPHLAAHCTPSGRATTIYLPAGTANRFSDAFKQLDEKNRYLSKKELKKRKRSATYTYYKVRDGDSWWRISRRYRTTVQKLKRWNPRAARKRYLQPGMRLRIYRL